MYINYRHNLNLFTFYNLFSGKLFVATTQVLFLSFKGYTFMEIMLISSVTQVLVLFLELPSGIIADVIGNKKSMAIGMSFAIIANAIIIMAVDFKGALIYSIVCAVQEAMQSGADHSYLYNMLSSCKKESEFKKILRQINSKKMLFIAFVTILSGLLFKLNPYIPFLVTTLFNFFALLSIVLLQESTIGNVDSISLVVYIKDMVIFIKQGKYVILLILLGACYTFLFMNQNVLLQQYLTEIKMPLELFGVVFFVFNMVSAYVSKVGEKIEGKYGENTKIVFTVVMIICLIGSGIFRNVLSLILLACCRACIAIINPIMSSEVNNSIANNKTRTTILSLYNALTSIPDAFASPILGNYIDKAGIFSAYIVFGITGILPLLICFMIKSRVDMRAFDDV